MIDLCKYAVSVGEKSGADEIEAVWVKDRSTIVEAELGEISKTSAVHNEGIKIRVVKDKALSAAFTYQMDKDAVRKVIERALSAARACKKDETWDSLPSPKKYVRANLWDRAIEEIDSEAMIEPIIGMLKSVPKDIAVYIAVNQVGLRECACVSSSGVEHEERGTQGGFGMMVVGILEEGMTPGFEKVSLTRKYDPHPQEIADTLTERVNLFKRVETASSGKSQVIFSPQALQSLFEYTLFKAISGENIARGKSLFCGKLGEKVASSSFTLHDNGIIPEGFESREMDDEGVPRQDTPLIEKGVLSGFIWNDYWAKRMGLISTGNAHYDDRTDEMAIQQTTMVVDPGDYTMEELLDVKDGYYVLNLQGAHGSNPESGDFSVVCTPAYRIRDGAIAGGVIGMMLSDNVFSLLKNVEAVENKAHVDQYIIMPHIRFSNVSVIGR